MNSIEVNTNALKGQRSRSLQSHLGRVLFPLLAVVACIFLTGSSVQADPLNLTPTRPDISALNLGLSFTSSTSSFRATGSSPNSFFLFTGTNGATTAINNGSYALNATINSAGVFSGGTFSIMGNGGTLLTGALTSFGFTNSGSGSGTFEFTFNTISSNPLFGFGPTGGIILSSSNLTPGNWSFVSNFSGTASSNNFATPAAAIPEPASIILLSLGGLGLAAKRRRSKKQE